MASTFFEYATRRLASDPAWRDAFERLEAGEEVVLQGLAPAAKVFVACALSSRFGIAVAVVCHPDLFSFWRTHLEIWKPLLHSPGRLVLGEVPFRLPWLHAWQDGLRIPDMRAASPLALSAGARCTREDVEARLRGIGYERGEMHPYEYRLRGETLELGDGLRRFRLLFGPQALERVWVVEDPGSDGGGARLVSVPSLSVWPRPGTLPTVPFGESFGGLLLLDGVEAAVEGPKLRFQLGGFSPLASLPAYSFQSPFPYNLKRLQKLLSKYDLVAWVTEHRDEAGKTARGLNFPMLEAERFVPSTTVWLVEGKLRSGFSLPGFCVLSDTEMRERKMRKPFSEGEALPDLDLPAGTFVVHVQHGIGRFEGKVERKGGSYAVVAYAEGDKLYVPSDRLERLHRYVAADGAKPKLSRLGTAAWEKTKQRVRIEARKTAERLFRIYRQRKQAAGFAFSPDTPWQKEMEESFPFEETEDQMRAMAAIKRDMEQPHPMDRLLLGDVGFGKTELAVRAAFKAVQDSKQVALLAPTTVLAHQHGEVFRERLRRYPVKTCVLSRLRSAPEQREIAGRARAGEIDILIGTHRLLQADVSFRDLGLLIVDEEQRFGVLQKEHFKERFPSVDILTLTATPIPRTLHMAFSGLRDVSRLSTPLPGREPVTTRVVPYDEELIRERLWQEVERGGQAFFVCPRVDDAERLHQRLRELLPPLGFGLAHGQMPPTGLERRMVDFVEKKYDVLVCTTIIENGLDIPSANTMMVYDAHRLGLAQLHQLRGRVGRGTVEASCDLLIPHHPLGAVAQERLQALSAFAKLGSGFELSRRDLELRGAGSLLGPNQSGFVAQVGLTLYTELIQEALSELGYEA